MRASAGQLFEIAATLEKSGKLQRAEEILKLLQSDPNEDVSNEARYRRALLMEATGRNLEAAVLLRRVLDKKPYAAAPRVKLATLLQRMGDEGAALRELRSLQTIDLPPAFARFVDRLSASLQATKPVGFQLELAFAPDSNINRATQNDTLGTIFGDFTLDEGSKATSGLGVAARGLGHVRKSLSEKLSLVARGSGEVRLFRDRDFNDILIGLSFGPEIHLGKTRVTAEAGAVQQWYGMQPYQRGLHIGASATRSVGSRSQFRIDAGYRTINNRLNDLQDGHGRSIRLRYERALSPTTLLTTTIATDRLKARDDAYSTRSIGGGVAVYRDVKRMTLSAAAEVGILNADDRLFLLPKERKDRLFRIQLGAVLRQLTVLGFAPIARLVVERNKSTVEFYDYKRRRAEFGVTRAF